MSATDHSPAAASSFIPDIRVPVKWTLGGLAAGLVLGILLEGTALAGNVLPIADVVGTLWLRGLQMTIVPLVAALLVIGIVQTVAAAKAGRVAVTSLALFATILTTGTVFTAFAMPALLEAFPIPAAAAAFGRRLVSVMPGIVFTSSTPARASRGTAKESAESMRKAAASRWMRSLDSTGNPSDRARSSMSITDAPGAEGG